MFFSNKCGIAGKRKKWKGGKGGKGMRKGIGNSTNAMRQAMLR